jgi:hypothetical protein
MLWLLISDTVLQFMQYNYAIMGILNNCMFCRLLYNGECLEVFLSLLIYAYLHCLKF